jgi:hypothetical protein
MSTGLVATYYNPILQCAEHFLEPWALGADVSSSRGDVATSFNVRAPRHFTVNATTAFLSSLKDIRETVEQSTDEKSELVRAGYSGLSAYTGYAVQACTAMSVSHCCCF